MVLRLPGLTKTSTRARSSRSRNKENVRKEVRQTLTLSNALTQSPDEITIKHPKRISVTPTICLPIGIISNSKTLVECKHDVKDD